MAIVVSDTSPIRALAHLRLLNLLPDLFGQVLIPPAVNRELQRARSRFAALDVAQFSFLQVQAVQDRTAVQRFSATLDDGESEALALALEVRADAVLIDEAAGREMAKRLGLHPVGTLGTLLEAKLRGRIGAIASLMNRLESELRFYISSDLRAEVLRLAGE